MCRSYENSSDIQSSGFIASAGKHLVIKCQTGILGYNLFCIFSACHEVPVTKQITFLVDVPENYPWSLKQWLSETVPKTKPCFTSCGTGTLLFFILSFIFVLFSLFKCSSLGLQMVQWQDSFVPSCQRFFPFSGSLWLTVKNASSDLYAMLCSERMFALIHLPWDSWLWKVKLVS